MLKLKIAVNLKAFLAAVILFPALANAQVSVGFTDSDSKFYYGGGIGASFGSVDIVSLSPSVGMNVNEKTSVGLSVSYVYRKDTREGRNLTTNDYATGIFGRYLLTPQFYLEADVEHLNNEFAVTNTTTDRREFNSFLAGGGIRSPLGGNAVAFFTVLYNFSHSDADSPYSDPLSIRGGISLGF